MASAPTGAIAATISSSRIDVSWTNHGPYSALILWWKISGGSYASVTLSTSATSYSKTGLTDGKRYYFYIEAEWSAGEYSGTSSEVNDVTTLINPTGAAATPSETTADLTWAYSGSGAESMKVYRGSTLIATLSGSATSYTATGLTPGVSYTFTIKAYTSAYGVTAGTSVVTATVNLPETITGMTLTPLSTTSLRIDWTGEVDADRVLIYYMEDGAGFWSVPTPDYVVAGVKTFTLTGLKYNQLYWVTLRGWNTDGHSPYNTALSTTTLDHSAWVRLDLGATGARAINYISFKTPADNFAGFTVHGSNDGSTWTLLYTGTAANTTVLQSFSFTNAVSYRYVKLTNTSNYAHNAMKIYTFKAYELPYTNEWLKVDVGVGTTKTPVRVIIQPKSSGVENWSLYGSNDDSAWTLLTSGKCIAGESENEFTFVNSTAYRYFLLNVTSSYGGVDISVIEWKLYELSAAVDRNYYLFRKETTFNILRRVLFSDLDSLTAFITAWETDNPSWDHAAWVVPTTDVSTANDTITIASHGLKENDRVTYSAAGGTAITGLVTATNYYLRDVTTNTFKLAATWGGAAIDLTGTGNNSQTFTPSSFVMGDCTFDDFYDNADVAEKITADGYTITEADLDALAQELLPVLTLTTYLTAGTMFGVPAAYASSLVSTGQTSLHELKVRELKQEYVGGAWQNVSPEEYIQTKYVFVTAGANLLLANVDADGNITGYDLLGTGLKNGTEPCWANFQNRAFMVNGTESDADLKWTNGKGLYDNGITAPTVVANGTVKTIAQTDISIADDTITITAHGLYNQQRVVYANGSGSDAGGLTDGTTYFVIVVDANTIKLSATAGGAAIDITSDGTTDDQTLTTTSVTTSASGGYMSDGTYYLKIKYRRTTYGGCSSNPSSVITVALSGGGSSQSIVLDVLRSADLQVDKIDVYRTKLSDSLYYSALEATNTPIADTVSQVTLTLADNTLGAQDLEEDNDVAPNSKIILCFGGINRMGYLTDEGLYFSKAGHPENVPVENFIPIGKDDGQLITGGIVVGDWCFIGKENSIYVVDLNNIEKLNAICLSSILGVLDWKTLVQIEDGQAVMWPTKTGFCISDGVRISNISRGHSVVGDMGNEEIGGRNFDDFVKYFDFSRKKECSAVFFPKRQLYICMTPYVGVDEYGRGNYRIWCYDIVKGSFFKLDFPIPPLRLFTLSDANDILRIVSSFTQISSDEYYGYFMVHDDEADFQDTSSITFAGVETKTNVSIDFVTSWTDLGLPERVKLMRMLFVQLYSTGPCTLTFTIGIDHKRYLRDQVITISPDTGSIVHEGETGTAPTPGRDEIEGYDYGRVKNIPVPIDAVGTDFSIRIQGSANVQIKLLGLAALFRVRGARPK